MNASSQADAGGEQTVLVLHGRVELVLLVLAGLVLDERGHPELLAHGELVLHERIELVLLVLAGQVLHERGELSLHELHVK